MNSPELREVYNANLPKVTQYYTELGQNQRLFEKFKQLNSVNAVCTSQPGAARDL
jgi:oligopeptidase A